MEIFFTECFLNHFFFKVFWVRVDALKQKLQSTLRYAFFLKIFHNGCQCLFSSYFVHVITLSTITFPSAKLLELSFFYFSVTEWCFCFTQKPSESNAIIYIPGNNFACESCFFVISWLSLHEYDIEISNFFVLWKT